MHTDIQCGLSDANPPIDEVRTMLKNSRTINNIIKEVYNARLHKNVDGTRS